MLFVYEKHYSAYPRNMISFTLKNTPIKNPSKNMIDIKETTDFLWKSKTAT